MDLHDTSANPKCAVDLDSPLFQPYPNAVVFENYEEHHTYTQPLFFRNKDKVPRRLTVVKLDDPYFRVEKETGSEKSDGSVAPGLEVRYNVTFCPHERKDYHVELLCITEREKFLVSISAPGPHPVLICQDVLDFGIVPCRLATTKTVTIYNQGDEVAVLRPFINLPYKVKIDNPTIPINGLTTLDVTLYPIDSTQSLLSSLVLVYGDNLSKVIELQAQAQDLDIGPNTQIIQMDPTYLSLESRKTFKIINNSTSKCHFMWKAFQTEEDDEKERQRLHNELHVLEEEEISKMNEVPIQILPSDSGSNLNNSINASQMSLNDNNNNNNYNSNMNNISEQSKSALLISRKYKTLHSQVDRDCLPFEDKNVTISPSEGEIWSHSEIELTVIFHPTLSADFEIKCFCELEGRLDRIPLLITGSGVGPKAHFSYDVLDIGDIFINSTHRYEVSLTNEGSIPCSYKLIDKCRKPNVIFTPPEGELDIEESVTIEVSYTSSTLGEFSDHFEFALKGATSNVVLTIKGHVVGPTFFFNKNKLDFGIVSFAFLNSTDLILRNTSSVPFKFNLRVPQDGNYLNKEFEIIPAIATILPEGEQRIKINFISQTIKVYDYCLAIDIENVGEALLTIPISAECRVAEVELLEESLNYGDCYLRYPYFRTLTLKNKSNLSARYEVTDQDERSKSIGTYLPDPQKGVIGPMATQMIQVQLSPEKLGEMRIPIYIQIIGSQYPPLVLVLEANGLGPVIKSNLNHIKFGDITCLDTHTKEFVITNPTPIPAPYKLDFKRGFHFNTDIVDGILQSKESQKIVVSCMLEDVLAYKDTIYIAVTEGESVILPVTAKGIGTTLFCEDPVDVIDFGDQFTNRTIERVFLLENRGLRSQRLTWINQTAVEKEKAYKANKSKMENEMNSIAGRKKMKDTSPYEQIFTITPNAIELKPNTACNFVVSGSCERPCEVMEMFSCLTKYDGEVRNNEAIKTEVKVNFINPLIQCSEEKIEFKYVYEAGVPCEVQTKTVVFKNISTLSLDVIISVAAPFLLSMNEFHLEPNESTNVTVEFDPNYKDDKISCKINGVLNIRYEDHPQKDSIPCVADVAFPNLWLSQNDFDFGCILNNSQRTLLFSIENRGTIPCPYHWELEIDETENQTSPINEVFEITPIQGILQPGESEEMELRYSGIPHVLSRALGKCYVDGGPVYNIKMKGESSVVSYRLDKQNIDFGRIPYMKVEERDFHIYNTGSVDFSYKISTDSVSRPGLVGVSPCSGMIPAHGQQRISVKMRVGIPDSVIEKIIIEIAHYVPIDFPLYITGIYANIKVNDAELVVPDNWEHYLEEADRLIELSNTEHPVSFPCLPSPIKQQPSLPDVVVDENGNTINTNITEDGEKLAQPPQPPAGTEGVGEGVEGVEGREQTQQLQQEENPSSGEAEKPVIVDGVPVNSPTLGKPAVENLQMIQPKLDGELAPPTTRKPEEEGGGGDKDGKKEGEEQKNGSSKPSARNDSQKSVVSARSKNSQNSQNNNNNNNNNTLPSPPKMMTNTNKLPTGKNTKSGTNELQITVDRESEALRLYYIDLLLDEISNQNPDDLCLARKEKDLTKTSINGSQTEGVVESTTAAGGKGNGTKRPETGLTTLSNKTGKTTKMANKKISNLHLGEFPLADYVVDFGNVVRSDSKTKTFTITNIGNLPVNFTIERRALKESGYTLTPDAVKRLPESSTVTFTASFTAKSDLPYGRYDLPIPIQVQGGPTYRIILRADVCIPRLSIIPNVLDFGELPLGRSKVMFVTLYNECPVTVDWSFKKEKAEGLGASQIKIYDVKGKLPSMKKFNAELEFTPSQIGEMNVLIPMVFRLNPGCVKLQVTAKVYDYNIEIIPREIQFDPIQPHLEPIEQPLVIKNISKDPIELYCLEYDQQYIEEEAILMQATDYDERNIIRTEVRNVGDKLTVKLPPPPEPEPGQEPPQPQPEEEVKEEVKEDKRSKSPDNTKKGGKRDKSMDKKKSTKKLDTTAAEEPVSNLHPLEMNPEDVVFPEGLKKPENYIQEACETLGHRENTRNLLIIGPNKCGKHSVAKKLAEYYEIPFFNISDIFKYAIENKTPMGWILIAKILRREELIVWEGEEPPKKPKKIAPKKPKKGETELPPVYFDPVTIQAVIKEYYERNEVAKGSIVISDTYEYIENMLEGIKGVMEIVGRKEYGGINVLTVDTAADLLVKRMVEEWKINNPEPIPEEPSAATLPTVGSETMDGTTVTTVTTEEPVPVPDPVVVPPPQQEDDSKKKGKKDDKKGKKTPSGKKTPANKKGKKSSPSPEPEPEPELPPHRPTDEELVTMFTNEVLNGSYYQMKENMLKLFEECKQNAETRIPKPLPPEGEVPVEEKPPEEPVQPEPEPVVVDSRSASPDPKKGGKRSKSIDKKGGGDKGKKGKKEEPPPPPPPPFGVGLLCDIINNNGEGDIDTMIQEIKETVPLFNTYGDWKVPEPEIFQLVKKPIPRRPLVPTSNYKLIDENSATRWKLEPDQELPLKVTFESLETGKFNYCFHFEIVNKDKTYEVPVSGICDYPKINQNPKDIFMKSTKQKNEHQIISKRYIKNKGYYEFGPLLIGKNINMRENNPSLKATNCETIQFSNNGMFPTTVDFSMQNDDGIFTIEPTQIDIEAGETQTVDIWAFPVENIQYTNNLVVCYKDNPNPFMLPFQCTGFMPEIDIKGLMNEEQYEEYCNKQLEEMNARSASRNGGKGGKGGAGGKKTPNPGKKKDNKPKPKKEAPPKKPTSAKGNRKSKSGGVPVSNEPIYDVTEIGTYYIDFDRVLINHNDIKTFNLINTGKIPIKFTINPLELENIEEIKISPKNGVLEPSGSCSITVSYNAIKEFILEEKPFEILIADNENDKYPGQTQYQKKITVNVKGETYVVKALLVKDAAQAKDDNSTIYNIDYGVIQVCENPKKSIVLENQGKYDIKFNFMCKGKELKHLFKLTPPFGVIMDGDKQEVEFSFKSDYEVNLQSNKDIRCRIFDLKNQELISEFPICISVRSVFSKVSCLPPGGISFGSLHFDESKTKELNIKNEGEFPFKCKISDINNPIDMSQEGIPSNEPVQGKGGKKGAQQQQQSAQKKSLPGKKGGDKKEIAAALTVGDFGINPADFQIEPGTSQKVSITYHAVGNKSALERLMFNISNIDPNVAKDLTYILTGESVYPSIETENYDSIFEEQTVLNDLSTLDTSQNVSIYSVKDNLFYVGTVIPTSQPDGISQRIRITNIQRIQCTVSFQITPKAGVAPEIFSISPPTVDIPPHEYQYVTIFFKPQSIGSYEATFNAKVKDSNDPKTGELNFDVRGSSILPSLQINEPKTRADDGRLMIDFGKIRSGKKKTSKIVIENTGVLTAKCHVNMDVSGIFSVRPDAGEVQTLKPKDKVEYTVSFTPRGKKEYELPMSLYVQNNPYEKSDFILKGVGLEEMIGFNGLPNDKDNEMEFYPFYITNNENGDNNGENGGENKDGQSVSFQIENLSDKLIKFQFQDDTPFRFNPSCGHMSPHTTKDVTCTFKTTEPLVLEKEELTVEVQEITLEEAKEGEEVINDWDNSMKTVKYVTKEQYLQLQKQNEEKMKENAKNQKGKKSPAKKPAPPPRSKTPNKPGKGGKNQPKKALPSQMPVYIPPPLYPPLAPDCVEPIEVCETLPEPSFKLVNESEEPHVISLYCSIRADAVKYQCECRSINFADTLMYQKREYEFDVLNESETPLDLHWTMTNENPNMNTMKSTYNNNISGSDNSMMMMMDEIPIPFKIEPDTISIPPSKSQHFKVYFEPLDDDFYNYTANANIPMLPKEEEPLLIKITGRSMRPLCHFDIPPCDYLSRRSGDGLFNQDGELGGSLDPDIHVLEIESLGTHVKNTMKFGVENPTAENLGFEFIPVGMPNQAFECVQKTGVLMSGKKQMLQFEFTPTTTGIQEAFYRFNIPSHNISALFLIAGIVKEPKIFLDPPAVNFNAVLLHRTNTKIVQLVNNDHIPFAFTFDKSQIGFDSPVKIEPATGSIPPNGSVAIEVTFAPQDELYFSTNISLQIHKKPSRLNLNVKGEGYKLHDKVIVQDGDSVLPNLVISPTETHIIDFGNIFLNETCTKTINFENSGNFPYDYQWSRFDNASITITPERATVNGSETGQCQIVFHPVGNKRRVEINNLKLEVTLGELKRYRMLVNAYAAPPKVNFSFNKYNFGAVAVLANGVSPRPAVATLVISNNEAERDVTVNCLYQKSQILEVPFQPTTLSPSQFVEVPIYFTPYEEIEYKENVVFEISGISTQTVEVKGRGSQLHLELVDLRQQVVNFGKVEVNSDNYKSIQIINRSLCTYNFEIVNESSEGMIGDINCVSITPKGEITIKPKQIVTVDVNFRPNQRLLAFENHYNVKINGGEPLSFFTVKGACQGVDVVIETSLLQFGAVCLGSSVTRKILLSNEGDKRTHFRWNAGQFAPNFSIIPLEGTLLPNTPMSLNITFTPQNLSNDIRCDNLICDIEGASEPLRLTLSGSCVAQPEAGDKELRFECEVRKEVSQVIKLTNPTNDSWFLHPAIQNEVFSGNPSVTVPAKGTVDYTVVFKPTTYNGDGTKLDLANTNSRPPSEAGNRKDANKGKKGNKKEANAGFNWNNPHKGNLFISLPDGNTVNYNLLGACSLPQAMEVPSNIQLETTCKKSFVISLPVYNWMKTAQRFKVELGDLPNNSTFVKVPNVMNIPALASRECQINFLAYKPGPTEIILKFICEETGEYCFYQFQINTTNADVMNTYELVTHVRQVAKQTITINNPLPPTAIITSPTPFYKTSNPCVRLSVSKELSGHKEGSYSIEYRPLLAGESECDVTIITNELGEFNYRLKLKALESGYERGYNLSCGLGGKIVEEVKFTSYCTTNTEYKCSIEGCKDFTVENVVKVNACNSWDGLVSIAKVSYEPCQIGDVKAILKIDSPQGGLYKYQLFGKCLPPQPLGPYTVGKGKQISVPFKNIFSTTKTFDVYFENPLFTGGSNKQSIPEKKEVQLAVKYAGSKDGKGGKDVLSKMIVSCEDDNSVGPWIYYIRGVETDTATGGNRKSKTRK